MCDVFLFVSLGLFVLNYFFLFMFLCEKKNETERDEWVFIDQMLCAIVSYNIRLSKVPIGWREGRSVESFGDLRGRSHEGYPEVWPWIHCGAKPITQVQTWMIGEVNECKWGWDHNCTTCAVLLIPLESAIADLRMQTWHGRLFTCHSDSKVYPFQWI